MIFLFTIHGGRDLPPLRFTDHYASVTLEGHTYTALPIEISLFHWPEGDRLEAKVHDYHGLLPLADGAKVNMAMATDDGVAIIDDSTQEYTLRYLSPGIIELVDPKNTSHDSLAQRHTSDSELIAALERKPYDRVAREAAKRLRELLGMARDPMH